MTSKLERQRHALHDVVVASEEDAVEPLVRLLQHEDRMVREQATIELGDLAQPVTERVTKGVSEAAGSAGERLRPVAEKAKDVGGKTAQKASEAYETTKSKVQEAQREQPITERVKEAANSVSERAHVDSESEGEHALQTCTQSSGDVLPATRERDIDYHKRLKRRRHYEQGDELKPKNRLIHKKSVSRTSKGCTP